MLLIAHVQTQSAVRYAVGAVWHAAGAERVLQTVYVVAQVGVLVGIVVRVGMVIVVIVMVVVVAVEVRCLAPAAGAATAVDWHKVEIEVLRRGVICRERSVLACEAMMIQVGC